MRKYIFVFAIIFTSYCHSASLTCSGTVEKIGLHASDKIMLKLSSMNYPIFICSPNAEWTVSGTSYKTSAETCNAMLSMFMHAKATNTTIDDVLLDGDDVPSSCNSWQKWKQANVRHFLY